MNPMNLFESARNWVGGRAFRVFLWASRTTAERYWGEVYTIEHAYRNRKPPVDD